MEVPRTEHEPFDSMQHWLDREAEGLRIVEVARANIARLVEDHRLAMQGQRLDELRTEVDENALTQAQINERFRHLNDT